MLNQGSWDHYEAGLAKCHSEFIGEASKWSQCITFPKFNISCEPIWLQD